MTKLLPTSVASFRRIIEGDLLYIDKTELIYELVNDPAGAYFLSRPRRFGKSLLLSTLEQLFLGKRDLFEGLWIADSDYEWSEYPVIRIDFSRYPSNTPEALQENIKYYLQSVAKNYGVTLVDRPYYVMFSDLIEQLSINTNVVILIDEYDKPIIDHITDAKVAEEMRNVLKGFYTVVKSMQEHIRMVFITGISKFSKVSIFSELNNLEELTFDPRFATLLGITKSELTTYFAEYLQTFSAQEDISVDELLDKIRHWYDGFRFTKEDISLYNPFSIMNLFSKMSFHSFWFESGTPTFLIKLLHEANYDISLLDSLILEESGFSTYEVTNLALIPLLFQTGYLTVKEYDAEAQMYTLSHPNYEVENAFLGYLLDAFSMVERGFGTSYLWRSIQALRAHDLDQFFDALTVLFANIDYDLQLNYEKYYQTIFYLIFKLMGLRIDAEVKTNHGRIDTVVELADRIYLFEFKLDQSATKALEQIQTHAYYKKYQLQDKPISCVGVNFDTATRNIDEWKVESI